MKICLIREHKQPADARVALSPAQCKALMDQYPKLTVGFEPSPDRCFTDDEYLSAGINILDPESADILLGIKEVPKEKLIPNKTYLFFSHTIKEQAYNQEMFQAIIAKQIELIDYECLANEKGRVLGFGRWAGIIGAYNGLLTWGKKHHTFQLTPAHQLGEEQKLYNEVKKALPDNLRIALTGGGRVTAGAIELLSKTALKEVQPTTFLEGNESGVFTVLDNHLIYERKDGKLWDTLNFYNHHENYRSTFGPYLAKTNLLINGMYWEDSLPPLFAHADLQNPNFSIQVIADITCDVEGSVPITWKATPIQDPVIGWDKAKQEKCDPFTPNSIDVMAVTNLPAELPRAASEDFGQQLIKEVLPFLINNKTHPLLADATLTRNGQLTSRYEYLKEFAQLT